MGLLNYGRHFALLICLVAVLAATSRWSLTLGAVASFGMYGALHSYALAATLRESRPLWKGFLLVAAAAACSMLSVSTVLYARRLGGTLPGLANPRLLLAASCGFGAAAYGILIRRLFAPNLTPRAIMSLTLGCVAAPLAVLASGIYLHGGGLWFAAFWWFAFSIGLWLQDRRALQRA